MRPLLFNSGTTGPSSPPLSVSLRDIYYHLVRLICLGEVDGGGLAGGISCTGVFVTNSEQTDTFCRSARKSFDLAENKDERLWVSLTYVGNANVICLWQI